MARKLAERELTSEGPRRDSAAGGARRARRTATVNLAESPLSWLYARGHIERRLFDAGEALRADYERAQLGARVTMRWDPVRVKTGYRGNDSGLSPTERQMAAKDRFDGAMAHAGRDLADVLWRVVCAQESLADAERSLEWPARSGKLVLRIALERVAAFYRIG